MLVGKYTSTVISDVASSGYGQSGFSKGSDLARLPDRSQFSLMRSEDGCVAAAVCILLIDLFTAVNPVPVAPHCSWGWDAVSCSVVSMTPAIRSHFTPYWRKEATSCSALGLDTHPYPLPESQFKPHLSSGSRIPASLPFSSSPHPCPAPSWNINSLRAGLDPILG